MATSIVAHIFVSSATKFASMLDSWLSGKNTWLQKNDKGEPFFGLYDFEGAQFTFLQPQLETTNTPSKVKGSTCAVRFMVDSKAQVDAMYKKAVSLGFMSAREPSQPEGASMYLAVLQDPEGQWWHVATMNVAK